jgi:hypothetical protein
VCFNYFIKKTKNCVYSGMGLTKSCFQLDTIVVPEDFEVKNGVLGFDRDLYLSIVKFLDSSIVRKV